MSDAARSWEKSGPRETKKERQRRQAPSDLRACPPLRGKNPKGHHHDMLSLYQAFLFALSASSCLAFYQLDCVLFILLPAPASLAFIVYLYYLSDLGGYTDIFNMYSQLQA